MLRLLFFIGVGIGAGGVVVQLVGPPGAGVWTIAVSLTLIVGTGILMAVLRTARGISPASDADIAAARAAGRSAVARVDAIRQTGTLTNDQPLCELDVTVLPRTGAAFRTTVRRIVRIVDVPRFQAGSVHSAVLLVPDGPEIALVDEPEGAPPADASRIPHAAQAGPILRPEPGTIPMGGRRRRPFLGVGRRGRPARFVLFVATALIAAAAVVAPYHVAVGQSISALQEGRLHADLRSPEHLTAAVDAISAEVGHRRLISVTVAADFVSVTAPVRPGELASDSWMYRAGQVDHAGAASSQPRSVAEEFGADEVSWGALWPAAEGAATDAGYANTEDMTLSVRRGVDSDIDSESFGQQAGALRVVFSARDEYTSVFFDMLPDATGVERSG